MFKRITSLPDFRVLENLAREIWEEHYTPIIGAEQVSYMMEKFQKAEVMYGQASDESFEYYMVLAGNKSLAGYLSFERRDPELFLSKFYLEKGFRGRGLAREMMRFLEEIVRNKNLKRIGLTVNKYNAASINAYKALGFQIIEPVVFDIGGGFIMDDFRMEKKLA